MKKQTRERAKRYKYIPPETRLQKRQAEIERVVRDALFEKHKALSARAIAKEMKVSHGGWLMEILCEMAYAGHLKQNIIASGGGVCKTRSTFTLPHHKVAAAADTARAA